VARDALVSLDGVADQPRAVGLLRRALASDRVAHAYAFVGPTGAGRTTTALAFAAELLAPDHVADHARLRGLVAARQHPDLHVIVPTPPARNPKGPPAIRMDDLRQLQHEAGLKPVMAPRKVFVLDDAHRLTADAPEAFLKTLEEPPDRTVMILVLPRVRALPATVLSRCQIVRFAARPHGGLADEIDVVLSLLDDVRAKGIDALSRRLPTVDRERAESVIDACWHLLRDVLIVQAGAPARLLTHAERTDVIAREATRWRQDDVLSAIAACREARLALVNNVTPRLTVEVVVSRLLVGAA
jgi:DNA polymerase III gamma/tau subunit